MFVIFFVVSVFVGVSGIYFSEEEHLLPPLFHLDDYDRCLSDKDGLYCLGTFELYPEKSPNPVYNLMQEFSREKTNYNRTLIHRGYCVSSRCPSDERNASLRFERCVTERARSRSLNARLRSLSYCRTRAQAKAEVTLDTSQVVFAYAVGVILFMNIVGTVYDCYTGKDEKKNALLLSWSIPYNWRRLMFIQPNKNSELSTAQGIRVVVMILMILVHNGMLQHTIYLQNPIYVEEMTRHPLMMIIQNGTSSAQIYTLFSTILGAYYLLKSSPDGDISLSITLKHILKRMCRLTPVHLFVVGFAATWWPIMGEGPLWTPVVEAESIICKKKIWYHFFFISNLVDPADKCLLPTWFLCADLQLHLVAAICIYFLAKVKHATSILVALFVTSCLMNAVLAYFFNWTAMMYVVQSPEEVRVLFQHSPSYYLFYTSPWGGLPTCFLGVFAAYCMAMSKKEKTKESTKKPSSFWLSLIVHLSIPILFGWVLMGNFIRHVTSRVFLAAYAAIDRVLFLALATLAIGTSSKNVVVKDFFSWNGWQPLSRLSLPVMLIHWCLNLYLIGRRARTYDMTMFNMVMDGTAVGFVSYILALPVSVLLELPVQKFLKTLMS